MAEKEQQMSYANGHSNTEAGAAHDARALRKKKRTKCFLYIVLFVIFQLGVIAVFGLTIMKVRTPKFRIVSAQITTLNVGTPASPSLSGTVSTQFSVKNANFGRYKYRNTTVEFLYRGTPVGQALVRDSRAGWRSTRRFLVAVDLNLGNAPANSLLASDLNAGVVPITTRARMMGRVELIYIMKKNKATNMNCSMEIVTATQQMRNIICK